MQRQLSIKEKLHQYIDTADEKKLLAIYAILEDEIEWVFLYTQEERSFYDRRQKHLNGESKSYTVGETLDFVRQNKKTKGL